MAYPPHDISFDLSEEEQKRLNESLERSLLKNSGAFKPPKQQASIVKNEKKKKRLHSGRKVQDRVHVAVRVRPLIPQEKVRGVKSCINPCAGSSNQLRIGVNRLFTFDSVFMPAASQEGIYKQCVYPILDGCMEGYNGTVFAYGQTGSGKTYTMGSGSTTQYDTADDVGMIPRVVEDLFGIIEHEQEEREFLVKVQYLEIYNEEVRDLLSGKARSASGRNKPPRSGSSRSLLGTDSGAEDSGNPRIHIREGADGSITLSGARTEVVRSREDLYALLERGNVNRTVGNTAMNEQSSRSHSIFTIIVEQELLNPEGATSGSNPSFISAKFHLVDLAGSERNKRTGNVGIRFKESVNINSGLLALGNVISALSDTKAKGTRHVPYRESKLTRMLQDSLGGNSQTCMLACLSPADDNFEESLNTLKYANRAKNIRNKPILNRDESGQSELAQLKAEIFRLQSELAHQKDDGNVGDVRGHEHDERIEELKALQERTISAHKDELKNLQERLAVSEMNSQSLRQELQRSQSQLSRVSEQMFSLQTEKDHMQLQVEESRARVLKLSQFIKKLDDTIDLRQSQRDRLTAIMKEVQVSDSTSGPLQAVSERPRTAPLKPITPSRQPSGDKLQTLMEEHEQHVVQELAAEKRMKAAEVEDQRRIIQTMESQLKQLEEQLSQRPQSSPSKLGKQAEMGVIEAHRHRIRELEEEIANANAELDAAKAELANANADLERDEEIFAKKIGELREVHRQVHVLQAEQEELLERIHFLEGEVERRDEIIAQMKQSGSRERPQSERSIRDRRMHRLHSPISTNTTLSARSPSPTRLVRTQSAQLAYEAEQDDEVVFSGTMSPMQPIRPAIVAENSPVMTGAPDIPDEDGEPEEDDEELAKLQESTQQLDTTFEELSTEHEKTKTEHQRDHYEKMSAIRDLNINIKMKEQLIKELVKNEKRATEQLESYGAHIHQLESEVERLRSAQDTTSPTQTQLEQAERRIAELKEQQRLAQTVVQNAESYKERTSGLEAEVQKMRFEQNELLQKLADSDRKHLEEEKKRQYQLTQLKRQAEQQQKKIRELTAEKDRQQRRLEKKEAEISLAKQKLKDATTPVRRNPDATPSKKSQAEEKKLQRMREWIEEETDRLLKQKQGQEELAKDLEKREQIIAEKENSERQHRRLELKRQRQSVVIERSLAAVNVEIEDLSAQLQNMDDRRHKLLRNVSTGKPSTMQELTAQIETLRQRQEALVKQRSAFEEKLQSEEFLGDDDERRLQELTEHLEALNLEIEYKNHAIEQAQQVLMNSSALTDANQSTLGVPPLTPARSTDGDRDQTPARQGSSKLYLEKLVELKQDVKTKEGRIAQLELLLSEGKEREHRAMQEVKRQEMEYERRYTELQKEHEQKLKVLLKQIDLRNPMSKPEIRITDMDDEDGGTRASVNTTQKRVYEQRMTDMEQVMKLKDEQLRIVEKDLYYYRQTNRELKRKLRDLQAFKDSSSKERESSTAEIDTLSKKLRIQLEMNAQYRQELAALKQHYQNITSLSKSASSLTAGNSPSVTEPKRFPEVGSERPESAGIRTVRKAMKELRPVSREDVRMRVSHVMSSADTSLQHSAVSGETSMQSPPHRSKTAPGRPREDL